MTSGHEGQNFDKINSDAWLKLVCTVYLLKHKTLFNSEPIDSLHTSLQASQLSPQKKNLLKWLAYSGEESITNLSQWHDFTRRVCFYHSSASRDHEYLLIPSCTALKYHMLRCQYIIKLVYTSMQGQAFADSVENYGWKDVSGKIQIVWENEDFVNKHCTSSKGCGCKGGCDGSKAGCKNCYRMCKPCTPKCKCKINCKNPHNNGGKCDKCRVVNADVLTITVNLRILIMVTVVKILTMTAIVKTLRLVTIMKILMMTKAVIAVMMMMVTVNMRRKVMTQMNRTIHCYQLN